MRARRLGLLASFSVILIVGCARDRVEIPQQPSESKSSMPAVTDSSSVKLPYNGAPHVSNPFDVTKFKENPCSVLTRVQLKKLGVDAAGAPKVDAPLGSRCEWSDGFGSSGAVFSAVFFKGESGLSGIYGNRGVELKFFEEVKPIEGQPAVIAMPDDDRNKGGCQYVVGLSDRQALIVNVGLRGGADAAPNYKNPCGVLQKLVQEMVRTIKGSA